LFKRKGRGLEPSELGELVFRYADRMFTLSQEMLDIVNYRKESNLLFDVGVADALSKRLVSGVLDAAVVEMSRSICAALNPPTRCCWSS
jgi:LysR family transcriptional activator of nhaA